MTTKSDDARMHSHVTDEADYLHDILALLGEMRDDLRAIRNTLESLEGS